MTRLNALITALLLALPLASLAQTPFPRKGDNCPSGSYKSGEYCIPHTNRDGSSEGFIQREGHNCPRGYYKTGAYCRQYPDKKREAIPREGKDCPRGWMKSGEYCQRVSAH